MFCSVPLIADNIRQAGATLQKEADQQRFLFGNIDSGSQSSQAPAPIVKPKLLLCAPKTKHEALRERLDLLGIGDDLVELLPPLSTLDAQNKLLSSVKVSTKSCFIESAYLLSDMHRRARM